jgi:putative flippase GtrA
MLKQYTHFFINGVAITLFAWILQFMLFKLFGGESSLSYGIATSVAFSITMIMNFFIQMKLIFKTSGLFHRYLATEIFIMVLVSFLAPLCRFLIAELSTDEWGDRAGFALAALIGSVPSFLMKRYWVFSAHKIELDEA